MLKQHITKSRKQKAQSTVEYIILFAAIVAALIIFLRPGGIFSNAVGNTFQSGTNGMTDMANRLQTSRPASP